MDVTMNEEIVEEAKRCLQCKKPRCRKGCLLGTPVNEMVNLFLAGNMEKAGALLFENNPLSIICSMICPHENFCEGH
jgi:glutamate synthase (NADPH) small chain